MDKNDNLIEKNSIENIIEIRDDNQYIIIYIKAFIRKNIFKIKVPFKIVAFILLCLIAFLYPAKNKSFDHDENTPYFFNRGYSHFISQQMVRRFNNYMNICRQNILIDNTKYNLTKTPKISVIMPLYNGGKYLYYSLRSIQNQDFKDIEIILIDDHSTDDTLEIVSNYMKEDPRIRLIKNERNRRILFSKSMAALYANGEYIIEMDQDDMFIIDNVFSTLYNEAKKDDYDLIQFQDFYITEFRLRSPIKIGSCQLIYHNEDTTLKQPEIKNGFFNGFNYLLWGLLIKADIYKKAVQNLWPMIINFKIVHFEDYQITFLFAAYAKSFRFLNYYFLLHLYSENSTGASKEFKNEQKISHICFMNSMIDYHIKDHPDDILMLFDFIDFMKDGVENFKEYQQYKFYKFVMTKTFNYLSYDQKVYLKDVLNLTDYKINNTYEYFASEEEFNSILSYQDLINSKSKKNIKNINLPPKFSIIIYTYNDSEFLGKTLNSIQNQNYDNFEIILICDFCKNLEEIKNIIEDYINIQLISYPDKKGLLYSYSEAILKSNGEYILTIKSGYTLSTNDVLYNLTEYIYNNTDDEIDIFEFNLLINTKEYIENNSLILYKCLHFESEVELEIESENTSLKYNKDYKNFDQEKELLINKVIKSDIYQTIIKKLFLLYKENIIYNYFDEIIFYLFNQNKIKSKNINFTGIIEYPKILNSSEKYNDINSKIQLINDSIFYINFLFDNTPNTEKDKLYALNEFYNLMPIIFGNNIHFNEKGKQLIYKFLNCKYIPQYNKNLLKFYYNGLIDRNISDLIA